MKKVTLAFLGLLFIAVSCTSNEVGHDATDKYIEPKEETKDSPKESPVQQPTVEISNKSVETDFRIEKFFKEGEVSYIEVREVTYEEDENATFGRSLGVPVVSEERQIFQFKEASYFDCSHTDQVPVDSVKSKWELKRKYDPIRIKTEEGIITEFYFDDCSG